MQRAIFHTLPQQKKKPCPNPKRQDRVKRSGSYRISSRSHSSDCAEASDGMDQQVRLTSVMRALSGVQLRLN